jgi:DNA end-binding protein Ku
MAARPTWRGSLKISLISVPIRVFPATRADADVSFHQIHRVCRTRIQLKKWCPKCDIAVEAKDIVKGHETGTGRYAIVEDEEIAAVRPASTKTVDVSDVLDVAVIDPIYIERTYYLAPDTKAAGEPFAVIREGLEGKAAVGRLALHGREYLVAIVPRGDAMLLHTLRTKGEVRAMSDVDEIEYAAVKVKAPEVKLARQVLSSFETGAELTSFTDHYQEALKEMLSRKREEEVTEVGADEAAKPAKVVNLMDALRKSLATATRESRTSAAKRAGSGRRSKVLRHPAAKTRRRAS